MTAREKALEKALQMLREIVDAHLPGEEIALDNADRALALPASPAPEAHWGDRRTCPLCVPAATPAAEPSARELEQNTPCPVCSAPLGGYAGGCAACTVEAAIGTDECPHPVVAELHTCRLDSEGQTIAPAAAADAPRETRELVARLTEENEGLVRECAILDKASDQESADAEALRLENARLLGAGRLFVEAMLRLYCAECGMCWSEESPNEDGNERCDGCEPRHGEVIAAAIAFGLRPAPTVTAASAQAAPTHSEK